MKQIMQGLAMVVVGVSAVLGALLVYGRAQYEFRYNFAAITLGTGSGEIVSVLGEPEGRAQSLAVGFSEDARDSYTNTVAYRASYYLFWRQGSVTYYIGFDTGDTAAMMVVRLPNGEDHICQVKGRARNRYKICSHS